MADDIFALIRFFNRDSYEEQVNSTCDLMSSGGYSLIVDLTWGGWMAMKDMAESAGFPYVRVESSIAQFVQVKQDRVTRFVRKISLVTIL